MSKVESPGLRWAMQRRPREVCGWRMDPESWLHQLFLKRMKRDRDLKIIITASDAQTGVGKSTLAFTLAASWQSIYGSNPWRAERNATFDVGEFLHRYTDAEPGSVLMMEEAEQLDSRRAMASENVDFSHYWMAMRVRQVCSILTLPSTTALDKRLWELADVWLNVERRGKARAHECQTNDYQAEGWRQPMEYIEWPDTSDHPEMQAIDEMKEEKINRGLADMGAEDEEVRLDPDEIKREEKIQIAQQLRVNEDVDVSGAEIGEIVGRSDAWVYNNTKPADELAN
jgi:hypothetical protein